MNPRHAYNNRALLAHDLQTAGFTHRQIAVILRAPSRETVRQLIGRAQYLLRQPVDRLNRLVGWSQ